jgi:16S rRNA C967 or C1407 C5-methylase (RsmB/RsmF family)/NOL1/NOP2/fmu family ribosome biogenesis protein
LNFEKYTVILKRMNKQDAYQLPNAFVERIYRQFGCQAKFFLDSLEQSTATSLRINPRKIKIGSTGLRMVPWCSTGFFLDERPIFTLDPLLHAGAYYVQESSSMFLEQVFRATMSDGPRLILDLCGAPGGKSTHLLTLMNDDDMLISNEVIQPRAKILQENIRKWGPHNVVICNNDPKDFKQLTGFFDLILIDAPCSGEGLFRRDAAARNEWSPNHAGLCSVRQRRILADIWTSLKAGGYMIYSTCTFNPEENEENLKWLQTRAKFESIRINLAPEWNIEEIEHDGVFAYRFWPHKVSGEGFFITLLRKTEEQSSFRFPKKMKTITNKIPADMSYLKKWVSPGDFDFLVQRDMAVVSPSRWRNEIGVLRNLVKVTDYGLPIAELKGKDITPHHFLALSSLLQKNEFETIGLDLEEALTFLRKEEIKPISDIKGWQLVCFRDIPLGFLKNIGPRTNNYFPKEWRIRMQNNKAEKLWHEEINL